MSTDIAIEEQKELTLRDELAIDRTKLANLRTLLASIRTGLYFSVIGLTVISVEWLEGLKPISAAFFIISLGFLVFGILSYRKMNHKINRSYR